MIINNVILTCCRKIKTPEVCPFCGSKLVKKDADGAHYYCMNKNCREKNHLLFFFVFRLFDYFLFSGLYVRFEFVSRLFLEFFWNGKKFLP